MSIVLYRVDERLIHGQVIVGWGGHLRPDQYLVVDTAVASSEWEQELYSLGVPERVGIEFIATEPARERLHEWRTEELRSVLLTRGLDTMSALARGGALDGEEINIGGLHLQKGRSEVLPFVFLDESDRLSLREMADEGLKIFAQALPGAPKIGLETLLG